MIPTGPLFCERCHQPLRELESGRLAPCRCLSVRRTDEVSANRTDWQRRASGERDT